MISFIIGFTVGVFLTYLFTLLKRPKPKAKLQREIIPIKFYFAGDEVTINDNGSQTVVKVQPYRTRFDYIKDHLTTHYKMWLSDYEDYDHYILKTRLGNDWCQGFKLTDAYSVHIYVEFKK